MLPYRFVIEQRGENWVFRLENGRFLFALPDRDLVVNQAKTFLAENGGILIAQSADGSWEDEQIFPMPSKTPQTGQRPALAETTD